MGEQVAAIITIMVLIIAVVAVVALGFGMFTTSKKQANGTQNQLINQLDNINKALFTELDQSIITGIRLKGILQETADSNCAVYIGTLQLLGAQAGLGELVGAPSTAKAEANINGLAKIDMANGELPMAQLDNIHLQTATGTKLTGAYLVNYNTVLKNSIVSADEDEFVSNISMKDGKLSVNKTTEPDNFAQKLVYKDGQFVTQLDFATNTVNSAVLNYSIAGDFDKSGLTMSIADTAQFNSYVIKNTSGEYVGLVFVQRKK